MRRGVAPVAVAVALVASLAACNRPGPRPPTTTAPTTTAPTTPTTAPPTTAPPSTAPPTTAPANGLDPTVTTVRYGPFTVPGSRPGGGHDDMGMIHNAMAFNVERPCTNCYITGMQAGLVNADGSNANIDQGLWLHHMVMFDATKQDVTCPSRGPGLLGQRFFSSGNERTPTRTEGRHGLLQGAANRWNLIYDLMNMTSEAKQVYITVTYEHVPADTPNMREMTPVWLDINQCGNSERPAKTGKYSYDYTLNVTRAGKILGIGGHLHDGGTNLTIEHDGRLVCESKPTYGGEPEYIEGPASLHMPGMPHISDMSRCQGTLERPVADVAVGDTIKLTAHYDSEAHMQMHGEAVMGIAIGYWDMG